MFFFFSHLKQTQVFSDDPFKHHDRSLSQAFGVQGFVVDSDHQDPKEDLQSQKVHITHLRGLDPFGTQIKFWLKLRPLKKSAKYWPLATCTRNFWHSFGELFQNMSEKSLELDTDDELIPMGSQSPQHFQMLSLFCGEETHSFRLETLPATQDTWRHVSAKKSWKKPRPEYRPLRPSTA